MTAQLSVSEKTGKQKTLSSELAVRVISSQTLESFLTSVSFLGSHQTAGPQKPLNIRKRVASGILTVVTAVVVVVFGAGEGEATIGSYLKLSSALIGRELGSDSGCLRIAPCW